MEDMICIFCHLKGEFGSESPSETYLIHLVSVHKIKYDMDHVLERTVTLHQSSLEECVETRQMPRIENYSSLENPYNNIQNLHSSSFVHPSSSSSMHQNEADESDDVSSRDTPIPDKHHPDNLVMEFKVEPESHQNLHHHEKDKRKKSHSTNEGTELEQSQPELDPELDQNVAVGESRPSRKRKHSDSGTVPQPTVRIHILKTDPEPEPVKKRRGRPPGKSTVKIPCNSKSTVKIPWYAGCEFECRMDGCKTMFYYCEDLRLHIRATHCCPDEYLERFDKFETKAVQMECGECGESIKRHYSSVKNHLINEHEGMPLEAYQRKHKMKSYRVHSDNHKDKEEEVFTWAHQCEYKCKVCGVVFDKSTTARDHVKNAHGLTMAEYKREHGSLRIRETMLACAICQASILHDLYYIDTHVRYVHKMSCHEYYTRYVVPNRDVAGQSGSKDMDKQIETDQQETVEENKCDGGKELQGSHEPIPDEGTLQGDKLRADVQKWTNQCRYDCKVCGAVFHRYQHTLVHIKNVHGMTMIKYKHKHGNFVTQKVLFTCAVCQAEIVHSPQSLSLHLQMRHKMTVLAYYVRYVIKNLDVAPEMGSNDGDEQGETDKQETVQGKENDADEESNGRHRRISKTELQDINAEFSNWPEKFRMQCTVCLCWFENFDLARNHLSEKHAVVIQTSDKDKVTERDVNEWADLCECGCKICSKHFQFSYDLVRHLKHEHGGMTQREYLIVHKSLYTKKVQHCCLLCNTTVKHALKHLQNHLENKHLVDIEDYHRMVALCKLTEHDDRLLQYLNCTQFRCKICDKMHLSATTLWEHLALEHNKAPDRYAKSHGTFVTRHLDYKCTMCQQEESYNEPEFDKHLRKEHDTNLVEFHREVLKAPNIDEEYNNLFDIKDTQDPWQQEQQHNQELHNEIADIDI